MSKPIKSIPDQAFFHVVTRAQSIDSLIASLYQNPDQTTKEHFLSVNQHLQVSVSAGPDCRCHAAGTDCLHRI